MTEKTTSGVVGAGLVSLAALTAIGLVLVLNHRDSNRQRAELRAAVTLIARANCKELAVIRRVSLARMTDPAERRAFVSFYRQLQRPFNDALEKLGQAPCGGAM